MQSMFTTTRSGDILDFCANAAGILLSVLLWTAIRALSARRIK